MGSDPRNEAERTGGVLGSDPLNEAERTGGGEENVWGGALKVLCTKEG